MLTRKGCKLELWKKIEMNQGGNSTPRASNRGIIEIGLNCMVMCSYTICMYEKWW
jgi:hypothetical protein